VCDAVSVSLQDRNSFFPYQEQSGGRCEGELRKPTGNSGDYLIASLASIPDFRIAGNQTLRISWRNFPAGRIHIIARSLRDSYFYRMDAEQSSDAGHYDWPTNILVRTGLEPKEIGIVGFYVDEKSQTVFVPLALQSAPHDGLGALHFVVAYPHHLIALKTVFREIAPDGAVKWSSSEYPARGLAEQNQESGVPTDLPAGALHPGLFRADVIGKLEGGAPADGQFWIRVPAPGPDNRSARKDAVRKP